MHLSLFEAGDATPRAVRNVTLWLDFTRALNGALREQAKQRIDPRAYDRVAARLRDRCPTTDLLVARSRVRSPGSP